MNPKKKFRTIPRSAVSSAEAAAVWLRRMSWLVAAALIFALAAAPCLAGGADLREVYETRAKHPLWIQDQATGKGYRVADLTAPRIAELREKGAGTFASEKPAGLFPAQIRHFYKFDEVKQNGAGQVIALVVAFHYPTAAADLKTFSKTFGLKQLYGTPGKAACTVAAGPHPCFQQIFATGTEPAVDTVDGWVLEAALDTQWAHAIAQGADILLVEAADNTFTNLLLAVDVAVASGASVVSMSFAATGGEVPFENLFDHHFNVDGVTFLGGSGDVGAQTFYPAVSPYVVAVGGTRLNRNSKGKIISETAWSDSGGGISQFEPIPGYQLNFPIPDTGGKRGNPDVAFNADPASGQAVYTTTPVPPDNETGWFVLGGTSISCPQWAGLIALANQRRGENLSSNNLARSPLYDAGAKGAYNDNYRDIKSGSNGTCGPPVCTAVRGYDFVTGLGSPKADHLVPFLARDGKKPKKDGLAIPGGGYLTDGEESE